MPVVSAQVTPFWQAEVARQDTSQSPEPQATSRPLQVRAPVQRTVHDEDSPQSTAHGQASLLEHSTRQGPAPQLTLPADADPAQLRSPSQPIVQLPAPQTTPPAQASVPQPTAQSELPQVTTPSQLRSPVQSMSQVVAAEQSIGVPRQSSL